MAMQCEAFTETELVSRVTALPSVSQHMPPGDEAELRWYLRKGGGIALFMPSYGKALERAALYSNSEPCTRCGGDLATHEAGCGFMSKDGKRFRQLVELEIAQLRMCGIEPSEVPRALGDTLCKQCDGRGWVERGSRTHGHGELTARPTGSSVAVGSSEPSVQVGDVSVVRLGKVTARLEAVEARSWSDASVLVGYYSQDGDELNAVVPWTPAGKTLLRRNKSKLVARQWLENDAKEARDKQDFQRLNLHTAAKQQALEIYRSAVVTWNQVVADEGEKIQLPRYVRTDDE